MLAASWGTKWGTNKFYESERAATLRRKWEEKSKAKKEWLDKATAEQNDLMKKLLWVTDPDEKDKLRAELNAVKASIKQFFNEEKKEKE